ncbi:MAG TPA: hypothetical protein VM841_05905 [Actinomycetota bacterium]|nr:hypothetical protein [Actinomycetota bacterium]
MTNEQTTDPTTDTAWQIRYLGGIVESLQARVCELEEALAIGSSATK